MKNKDDNYFYLEKLFPNPSDIISGEFKSIEEIKDNCLYVIDTNILLFPYKTSKNSLSEFDRIYTKLKSSKALKVPERVIREFGKNRGKNLAEVYKILIQKEHALNRLQIELEIPPILADEKEYIKLKSLKKSYDNNISKIKDEIQKLKKKVYDYNWNDPVSELYKKILSPDIIIPIVKKNQEMIQDLEFRISHSVAPGFKDSSKSDRGIGDLIIWQTIKELGKSENKDVIFVTDDSKNDWFYVEEKKPVYPRYELFYEFKKETNRTIHIINITDFLLLFNVDEKTIAEVKEQKKDTKESIYLEGKYVEEWVRISPLDIAVGMEVAYSSKTANVPIKPSDVGVVTKIDKDSKVATDDKFVIRLKYNNSGKEGGVWIMNYNWWLRK